MNVSANFIQFLYTLPADLEKLLALTIRQRFCKFPICFPSQVY